MQNLMPLPRPTKSESLGVNPAIYVLISPPGDSDACRFENHCRKIYLLVNPWRRKNSTCGELISPYLALQLQSLFYTSGNVSALMEHSLLKDFHILSSTFCIRILHVRQSKPNKLIIPIWPSYKCEN